MPQHKQKLTIVIGHDEKGVSFDAFQTITRTTVNLLRELDSNTLVEKSKSKKWQISKISMQSPLHLTLEPISVEPDDYRDIVGRFIEDIGRLERGIRAKYFTPKMERQAKIITRAFYSGVNSIRFISDDDIEAKPTEHLAANVDEAMTQNVPYFEVGSIEGYLEVLSVHNKDTVQVWDSRFNVPVECNVSEYQLKEAYEYLHKRIAENKSVRVVVRGNIKYKSRIPKSVIDVFDIRMLRDSQDLPQPEDIRPIDLTGDIDPVTYLRGDYAGE